MKQLNRNKFRQAQIHLQTTVTLEPKEMTYKALIHFKTISRPLSRELNRLYLPMGLHLLNDIIIHKTK